MSPTALPWSATVITQWFNAKTATPIETALQDARFQWILTLPDSSTRQELARINAGPNRTRSKREAAASPYSSPVPSARIRIDCPGEVQSAMAATIKKRPVDVPRAAVPTSAPPGIAMSGASISQVKGFDGPDRSAIRSTRKKARPRNTREGKRCTQIRLPATCSIARLIKAKAPPLVLTGSVLRSATYGCSMLRMPLSTQASSVPSVMTKIAASASRLQTPIRTFRADAAMEWVVDVSPACIVGRCSSHCPRSAGDRVEPRAVGDGTNVISFGARFRFRSLLFIRSSGAVLGHGSAAGFAPT